MLTIKGERKEEIDQKDEKTHYHRYERSFGSFARSFRLPPDTDSSKISADHKDGCLTVTIPKTPTAESQKSKIMINSENNKNGNNKS